MMMMMTTMIKYFDCLFFIFQMSQIENELAKLSSLETISNTHHQFETPFRCVLFGPSASGKSHWLGRLLRERDRLFSPVPTKFYWCYQRFYKDFHENLKNDIPQIEFFDHFDYEYMISKFENDPEERHCLILDDSLQTSNELELIFTSNL